MPYLELFIRSVPLPYGVTSDNLPQLGQTLISLCTAQGKLCVAWERFHHLRNPKKNLQRLQSCPGSSPLAGVRQLSPEDQGFPRGLLLPSGHPLLVLAASQIFTFGNHGFLSDVPITGLLK